MSPPKTGVRARWLWALWGLSALLALAWFAYWHFLRVRAVAAADAWVAAQRQTGAEAGYARVRASGFPLRLTLTFAEPAYQSPSRGWALSAPALRVHLNPSDLSLLLFEPEGAVTWRNGTAVRTLAPRTAVASARFRDGALERVSMQAQAIAVRREGGGASTIERLLVHLRPDARTGDNAQIALDIDDWALARSPSGFEAFGATVGSIKARVVIEHAATLARTQTRNLQAWRTAGGAVRVEGLALLWGPADLTASGRFTLDQTERAAGRLDMKLREPATALAAIARSPALPPAMARAMERSAEAAAAAGAPIELPLAVQDGVMRLGALPIRTIEPIQ